MNAAMTPATAPALVTKLTIYRQPGTKVGIFRMTQNSYKAPVAEVQKMVNNYKKLWVRHHYKSTQDAGKAYCRAHTQLCAAATPCPIFAIYSTVVLKSQQLCSVRFAQRYSYTLVACIS